MTNPLLQTMRGARVRAPLITLRDIQRVGTTRERAESFRCRPLRRARRPVRRVAGAFVERAPLVIAAQVRVRKGRLKGAIAARKNARPSRKRRNHMTAFRTASTMAAALFMSLMLITAASQPLIG